MSESSSYGLPDPRDSEGNLRAVDHTFEWKDGEETIEVAIQLVPPTLAELEEYQDLGGDVGIERLQEIVESHVEKPDRPASEMTVREVQCYIEGIVDYGMGGGSDLMDEIREEIEQRGGAEGN